MLPAILGKKQDQSQVFLTDGTRQPVTRIVVSDNAVVQVKAKIGDYTPVQLGFGARKRANKALLGHGKKAGHAHAPAFLKEIRVTNDTSFPKEGDVVKVSDVLKPGDVIKVTGVSKGKGFAGGVKRHQFKGGPRTHGQSDRERAPGSIGQTTTPGRVYKGKRMAGRMGHATTTVRNLMVLDIVGNVVHVGGLVPGSKNSIVLLVKTGEDKKFVPVYKDEGQKEKETKEENKDGEK
ncbi:MAG: 50S ribosomal protein L3 [Candidatus Levybacteria bacterium]|nr:50S ribosomal protein L3 [Candidatus Levybacteria bacterium]